MKRKRRSKEKTGCQHEKEAAVKGKDLLLWEAAVKGKDLRSGGPWGPLISRQASFHTHVDVAVALAVARADDADPVSLRVPVGDGNKASCGI